MRLTIRILLFLAVPVFASIGLGACVAAGLHWLNAPLWISIPLTGAAVAGAVFGITALLDQLTIK